MYKVKLDSRKLRLTFSSYEEARQYVRRCIRKITYRRNGGQPSTPFWVFGYSIVKI